MWRVTLALRDGPCKGCEDRHTLCWNECEKYKSWKAKSEAARETMIESKSELEPTQYWKAYLKRRAYRSKNK